MGTVWIYFKIKTIKTILVVCILSCWKFYLSDSIELYSFPHPRNDSSALSDPIIIFVQRIGFYYQSWDGLGCLLRRRLQFWIVTELIDQSYLHLVNFLKFIWKYYGTNIFSEMWWSSFWTGQNKVSNYVHFCNSKLTFL